MRGGKGGWKGRQAHFAALAEQRDEREQQQQKQAAVDALTPEERAVRAFSAHHRRSATLGEVQQSTAGVRGWAAEFSRQQLQPKRSVVQWAGHPRLASALQMRQAAAHLPDADSHRQEGAFFELIDGETERETRKGRQHAWLAFYDRDGVVAEIGRWQPPAARSSGGGVLSALSYAYGAHPSEVAPDDAAPAGGESLWARYFPAELLAADPAAYLASASRKRKRKGGVYRRAVRRAAQDQESVDDDTDDGEEVRELERKAEALRQQLAKAPAGQQKALQQKLTEAEEAVEAAQLQRRRRQERRLQLAAQQEEEQDAESYEVGEPGEDDAEDVYDDAGDEGEGAGDEL